MGRAQAYLREIKRGEAILGPALLLLLLLVATVWFGYEPVSREAAGQEKAAPPPAPKTPRLPPRLPCPTTSRPRKPQLQPSVPLPEYRASRRWT